MLELAGLVLTGCAVALTVAVSNALQGYKDHQVALAQLLLKNGGFLILEGDEEEGE